MPLSTSVLVVNDVKCLEKSFGNKASYLYQTHDNDYNLGQTSFECGRRNNALKLWTMWKSIGTKGISQIINHEFDLADFAREYVINNDNYKLYSFENSLSICFNYKKYDPIDLCSKLYEKNKVMVGFGYFNKQCFVRLVTINGENSKKESPNSYDLGLTYILKENIQFDVSLGKGFNNKMDYFALGVSWNYDLNK